MKWWRKWKNRRYHARMVQRYEKAMLWQAEPPFTLTDQKMLYFMELIHYHRKQAEK